MSRTHGDRSDPTDKVRTLKKQVDSLKRDVQRLERDLRKANSRIAELLNITEDEVEEIYDIPRKKGEGTLCENCGKGVYVAVTIPLRNGEKTFLTCNLCKERKPPSKG